MAAGPRSLLAFWMGGAGAAPVTTTAGVRSMLAPWVGGAGAAPVTTAAGVRSMLAPWVGGAGAAPVTTAAGPRGLLAFWMGGAGATGVAYVPLPAVSGGRRVRLPRALVDAQRLGAIDEDDTMLLIASALVRGGWLQ